MEIYYGEFFFLSSLQRKKRGIAKSYTQIKLKLPQINIRTFVNVGCSINPTLNAYELDVWSTQKKIISILLWQKKPIAWGSKFSPLFEFQKSYFRFGGVSRTQLLRFYATLTLIRRKRRRSSRYCGVKLSRTLKRYNTPTSLY